MSDPNPYDRPIRIRSLSDVNAAINTIAHKSANLIGLSVMKGQVFRADFVIGAKAKPTPLAPSRTFSLFFVPQAMKEKSFVTTFIKKTGGLKASTLRRADATTTWKYNFPESDEHIHFALTGANRFGDRNVYFFSVSPGRPDVKEAVSGMIQNLKKSDLGRDFQDESALMRSRWIGPGVVAGVLLLEALILVLSSSSVYRFGRGSDAGLPNLAAAVFFLVMGARFFAAHQDHLPLFAPHRGCNYHQPYRCGDLVP